MEKNRSIRIVFIITPPCTVHYCTCIFSVQNSVPGSRFLFANIPPVSTYDTSDIEDEDNVAINTGFIGSETQNINIKRNESFSRLQSFMTISHSAKSATKQDGQSFLSTLYIGNHQRYA